MNIQQAIKQIKEDKNIQYANELLVVKENEILVAINFKDIKSMKDFVFAWSMAIRQKTDQVYHIRTQYLLGSGEIQQKRFSYRPHDASRGRDSSNNGNQRVYKKPRFYHEEK